MDFIVQINEHEHSVTLLVNTFTCTRRYVGCEVTSCMTLQVGLAVYSNSYYVYDIIGTTNDENVEVIYKHNVRLKLKTIIPNALFSVVELGLRNNMGENLHKQNLIGYELDLFEKHQTRLTNIEK